MSTATSPTPDTASELMEVFAESLAEDGQVLDTSQPEPPATCDRVLATDAEGFLYDVDTGEVIGHTLAQEAFAVDDRDAAEWTLKLRAETEAAIVAIEAQLAAITSNLQAMRAHYVRKLAWWDWKFKSDLVTFAKGLLNGRSKTVQFTYGKVAFRTSAGSTEINDEDAALEFVRTWCPEKIRVKESVGVKATLEALAIAQKATGEQETPVWLVPARPSEECTIDTGVLTKGKKL